MKSLCTGSSMGEPTPPGRVLTPNPRLVQSEGGAQARVHLSFRLLRVRRWKGGRGGHQISRTPLTEPEPPHWEGRGHQGLHPCFRFLGTGDRSGPDPPQIRGLARVRAGRRRDGTSLPVTRGGPEGGGAALRDEHISRDPESRGLSHA